MRQARPAGATLQDYGMPSNHAQVNPIPSPSPSPSPNPNPSPSPNPNPNHAQTTTFLSLYCVLLLWHGCTVRHALLSKPI